MTKKELLLALIIVVFCIGSMWFLWTSRQMVEHRDLLIDVPTDGTPLLVAQNKVGDDTTPHIHQTWCQLLPYKRFIGDNQVFCYVETIDDWLIE